MTLIPVAKRCSTSSIAPHGRATFARPWRRPLHRRGRAGRPRNRRSVGHPGQLLRAPSLVSSCPIRVTHTACRASAPSPRGPTLPRSPGRDRRRCLLRYAYRLHRPACPRHRDPRRSTSRGRNRCGSRARRVLRCLDQPTRSPRLRHQPIDRRQRHNQRHHAG